MRTFTGWPLSWDMLLFLPALFLGFTVHELAHAVVAYALGDTSQVERRRLSFNPLRHVSWVGLVAFLLLGFGWAKPVQVDYTRLRIKNRPLGMFLVSVAGSASNLVFAMLTLFGIIATVLTAQTLGSASLGDVVDFLQVQNPGLTMHGVAIAFSSYVFTVNLILALFNLLPIPPLDGFSAMISLFTVVRTALRRNPRTPAQPAAWRVANRAGGGAAPTQSSPAQIHFRIGLDYHRQGLYDEAVVRYRQAIEQDPHFGLAYYDLGLAYVAKGRLALAAGAFRSTMEYSLSAGVIGQAELRLRELSRVGQGGSATFSPLPTPLDLETAVDNPANGRPPLDPGMARHVWLRLGIGGALFAIASVLVWLFVTAVVLIEVAA